MRRTTAIVLGALSFAVQSTGCVNAQETTSSPPIKIGMFAPLTGSAAFAAKVAYGASSVYKDINDHGGINGRKLELVLEDDACAPNKGIAAVKKLTAQDRVFLIHGGWCSNVVLAIKPEIERDNTLPYVVLGAASASISTPVTANIFQPVATTQAVANTMVDFALSRPDVKKVAIISHSDEWGKSHLQPAIDALKAHGLTPVETVYFERGSTDATSQTLKLRAAKPDAVLAVLYPAELAIYLRDAYKYGVRVPTIGTQGASIEDTERRIGIPDAVRDLYIFYPLSQTISSDQFKPWAEIFKKYYPAEPIDTITFIGVGGALAIADVIKRLGPDVTRERFLSEMNKLTNFDSGVQASTMSFSPLDHAGIKSGNMIHLVDGVPTIVSKLSTPKP